MPKLKWDQDTERLYETGVKNVVLYPKTAEGYGTGVAWNGVTAINESPSGADETALWADNIKYLSLRAAEEFGLTIEAYTYPDEFAICDGTASPVAGMNLGQQTRKPFGLCYRTEVGNDTEFDSYGYKIHLIYGCTASPSSRDYGTINDSPEAITFSWEVTTIPEEVGTINNVTYKPTASVVIDSTKVDSTKLGALLDLLYGTDGSGSGEGAAATLPSIQTVYNTLKQ